MQGVHLDAINARHEVDGLIDRLPADRVVSLGVANGRNIYLEDRFQRDAGLAGAGGAKAG